MDVYSSFEKLVINEQRDKDYTTFVKDIGSKMVIVAPHDGGIEPGTSEIAKSISKDRYSCYCFEGLKSSGNKALHITSTRFDDPECVMMCKQSHMVVSIHGFDDDFEIVHVGGGNPEMREIMIVSLNSANFFAKSDISKHSGKNFKNICNIGMLGGIQLEISNGLRKRMFAGLNRKGRETTTELFDKFIDVIQCSLKGKEAFIIRDNINEII
jgi:phage replication-related protein YjqB (UPF0714/DUF867 family)